MVYVYKSCLNIRKCMSFSSNHAKHIICVCFLVLIIEPIGYVVLLNLLFTCTSTLSQSFKTLLQIHYLEIPTTDAELQKPSLCSHMVGMVTSGCWQEFLTYLPRLRKLPSLTHMHSWYSALWDLGSHFFVKKTLMGKSMKW